MEDSRCKRWGGVYSSHMQNYIRDGYSCQELNNTIVQQFMLDD